LPNSSAALADRVRQMRKSAVEEIERLDDRRKQGRR